MVIITNLTNGIKFNLVDINRVVTSPKKDVKLVYDSEQDLVFVILKEETLVLDYPETQPKTNSNLELIELLNVYKKTDRKTTDLELIKTNTFGALSDIISIEATNESVDLLGSNKNRKEAIINNNSNKIMYVCFFSPATIETPIKLNPDEIWIEDRYLGGITCIWEAGVEGVALITEVYE